MAVSRTLIEDSGGFFRPEVGLSSDLELSLRAAAYGKVVYIDEPLLDFMVRADADSSTRLFANRASGDPRTPVGAAVAHAYSVHAWQRPMAPEVRRAVKATIARTHLQRAAQHRVLPGGLGRRGAFSDLVAAMRASPGTVLRPYHFAYGAAALGAPRALLVRAQRRLAARHARPATSRRERAEPAPGPDRGATRRSDRAR
jgi:hypothetical protein